MARGRSGPGAQHRRSAQWKAGAVEPRRHAPLQAAAAPLCGHCLDTPAGPSSLSLRLCFLLAASGSKISRSRLPSLPPVPVQVGPQPGGLGHPPPYSAGPCSSAVTLHASLSRLATDHCWGLPRRGWTATRTRGRLSQLPNLSASEGSSVMALLGARAQEVSACPFRAPGPSLQEPAQPPGCQCLSFSHSPGPPLSANM